MGLAFLVPAFLAGLAALAVPVWIHLRNRRRSEQVDFPSLMFLRQVPTRSVQRRELRYRALFALRCLAFALLAVAFARPFLPGAEVGAAGVTVVRERVLLVDRSWSMGHGDRWQRARAAVGEVLDDWRGGDRVSLVLFDEEAELAVERAPGPAAVVAALEPAEPGHRTTRFTAGLRLAQRILGDSDLPAREIVLVSDFQRIGWTAAEAVDVPEGTRLVPVDLSGPAANLTVADVALRRRGGAAGEADRLLVGARLTRQVTGTAADEPAAEARAGTVEVTLEIDGEVVQRRAVELPANGAAAVSFEPIPLADATLRGRVTVPPDALPGDNRLNFVVAPGQVLPVLVLESPAASETDSLYLRRALEAAARPSVRVTRRSFRDLDASSLRESALVILNDVGVPSRAAAATLRDWVAAGGGLWIVLGELSSDDGWPEIARELLPAGFGDPVDRSDDLGASLAYLDTDHPALEAFATPGSGDLGNARFYRYRPLRPEPADGVLARFDDGGAALVEHGVGEGRILVWTSTLDTFWNDLPLQPVYLPLVHGLARYAAGYVEPRAWLESGRPLSARALAGAAGVPGVAAAGVDSPELRITGPEGGEQLLATDADARPVRLPPGFATVRWGDEEFPLAINLDRRESDLATIDPEEVAAAVAWQAGAEPRAEAGGQDRAAVVERSQGGWWYLLVAAFAILAMETALSNRLSRHAS